MASTTTPEPAFASALGLLKTTAENATSYLAPSTKDLLMMMPRMAARAGSFVTSDIPGAFENMFGGQMVGRVIAEATGERAGSLLSAVGAAEATMATGIDGIPIEGAAGGGSFMQSFTFQQLRTFGGIFTYITSKWALGCFTAAILLNRTSIYASSRRNLRLGWHFRLALRIVPILGLAYVARSLLEAMRCQTSTNFSLMRYGVPDKYVALDFSEDAGLLHTMSSSILFWQSDVDSCQAAGMVPFDGQKEEFPRGSLSLLWPSFQSFCFAQFVETLSCALQGHATATETGMSLFEHSLAFAEAEAMVTNQIGLGPFGSALNGSLNAEEKQETNKETILVTRSFIVSRFNTPPEVLLMALISCLNNLSSQVLGVFGMQAKYRLINTGVWGIAFMGSTLWGLLTFPVEQGMNTGIFRFPTVCVVGFIPHTLILVGIFLCACIYAIALVIAILSPPDTFPREMTWGQRFKAAHENMQANIPLSGLRINLREDFYTALLRVGFTALTAASEAVYLNEGRRINVGHWTWLEEERMDELAKLKSSAAYSSNAFEGVANGVVLSAVEDGSEQVHGQPQLKGGYSRERSTKVLKGKSSSTIRTSSGVGARQRGTRYMLAFTFLSRIFWLFVGWLGLFLIKLLESLGVQRRPSWLSSLLPDAKAIKTKEATVNAWQGSSLDFWILSDSGELTLPQNDDVDVEAETKRKLQLSNSSWGAEEEAKLDSNLYSWFTHGGWWGEKDESGDYNQPPQQDDDTTSMISMSTNATESESEAENSWTTDSSGRQTPTQSDPYPESVPAPDHAIDAAQLARLLNPQDLEAKTEAQMLAAHLTSTGPVTRSRFRETSNSSKSQVLTSTRYRPQGFSPSAPNGRLNAVEEAELLEYLIVRFRDRGRQVTAGSDGDDAQWANGGEGLGAGGPMCVVCQSSPRTILAWPCRCLSLCEECRISLAMNNFATCVCCRQEVVAFSRLFVP